MSIIIYIVSAVVLLGFCVFVHELGHLLGGKMVGIKAKVFSLGYGKGFIKKKWGDTTYQITLIPFGGYCSFYGENASENLEGKSYEFFTASPWRRIVVVIMGPLFNLFFGILIFFFMNLAGYDVQTNKIEIPEQYANSEEIPAVKAGLKTGDTIISINEDPIASFENIQEKVIFSDGKMLNVKVDRDGDIKSYNVQPVLNNGSGYYTIGIWAYGKNVLIGYIVKGSAAEKSGLEVYDEIVLVNGEPVDSPENFTNTIKEFPGKEMVLTIKRAGSEKVVKVIPSTREIIEADDFVSNLYNNEPVNGVIADNFDIIENSIVSGKVLVNKKLVKNREEFINLLNKNHNKTIELTIPGGVYKGKFSYKKFGFLGVSAVTSPDKKHISYNVGDALKKSLVDPFDFIVMNLKGMQMLFSGKIAVRENLSGPIRIAKLAGDTAYYLGIKSFILLMAKISIILMIMNLLPIPAVDGSYILMFLYEGIRGKRINEKVMQTFQMIGFMILVTLFLFIMYNDISQLLK